MNKLCRRLPQLLSLGLLVGLSSPIAAAEPRALPPLVAHRGTSHAAPENTLAAIREAWKEGAEATEVDVRLTKDGHIVLCHDATTLRTSGVNLSVADSPLEAIRELDAGKWKGSQWAEEPFPTLAEALNAIPETKKILIEIKCGPEIMPALEKTLRETELPRSQMIFISFNAEVIRAVRQAYPEIPAHWLTGFRPSASGWVPSIDSILETLEDIDATGLDCNAHSAVDEAFVRKLREKQYEFHVWTVDNPKVAERFIELGVDSITTNRPQALRAALTKAQP